MIQHMIQKIILKHVRVGISRTGNQDLDDSAVNSGISFLSSFMVTST